MVSLFEYADRAEGLRDLEYRDHLIDLRREGEHWVAHWALPDNSTPEYRQPDPYPEVRFSGGFLRGPYESKMEAYAAAKRAVDANLGEGEFDSPRLRLAQSAG
jgi:hypothetical protein